MKKKYFVAIEETVNGVFYLEAESKEEALEKAVQKYKSGEFVLEPGELTYKQMVVKEESDDSDIKDEEWFPF